MTIYTNRCMIVPAAYAPLARALCAGIATGDSGSNMFIRAASTTGNLPATHFISSGNIEDLFAGLLPLTSYNTEGVASTVAGQPETIVTLGKGMVTLAQINALLAAVNVTVVEPHSQLSKLGLKLIQDTL